MKISGRSGATSGDHTQPPRYTITASVARVQHGPSDRPARLAGAFFGSITAAHWFAGRPPWGRSPRGIRRGRRLPVCSRTPGRRAVADGRPPSAGRSRQRGPRPQPGAAARPGDGGFAGAPRPSQHHHAPVLQSRQLAQGRFTLDPFGTGDTTDWSHPALGFTSICLALVEEDPAVSWDQTRLAVVPSGPPTVRAGADVY